jgi:transcriptional regulator with XRE-family HTH domain
MDPIQEAIEEIKSRELGASFSYRQVAKKYGISYRTLARRHQGKTQPRALAHLSIYPQREKELVQYIESLTKRRTPPSRPIIRHLASSLLGRDVLER